MTTDSGESSASGSLLLPETRPDPVSPSVPAAATIPPAVPRPGRRRRGAWIAVTVAVLVAALAAAGAVLAFDPYGVRSARALEKVDQRKAFGLRLGKVLGARAKALLAGDEKGWLAPLDPKNAALVADQRRTFRTLRAMRVSRYAYRMVAPSRDTADVAVGYCFDNPRCSLLAESEAKIAAREDGGRLVIIEYTPTVLVRPWELSDLRVEVGRRVVVAVQPKYAGRLTEFRKAADRAAVHASRFGPPDRGAGKHLLVFGDVGSATHHWYDDGLGSVKPSRALDHWTHDDLRVAAVEGVMRADLLKGDRLRFELAWHLGYAAAATGTLDSRDRDRWLNEGIAMYLGHRREDPALFKIRSALQTYLQSWDGDLEDFAAKYDTGAWWVACWGAVYRLIDRYGEKQFAAFHHAVSREGKTYDEAAREHFDRDLDSIASDIKRYLRRLS